MKANEINDWLAVVTNLGVIIGLGFVVYEVRLANDALDREFRMHISEVNAAQGEGWRAISFAQIENPEIAELWLKGNDGTELTLADSYRFKLLARNYIYQWRRDFDQYLLAYGNSPDWVININIKRELKESPGLRPVLLSVMESDPTVELFQRIRELDPEWLEPKNLEVAR